jgi:hypothetical protein
MKSLLIHFINKKLQWKVFLEKTGTSTSLFDLYNIIYKIDKI